MPQTILCIKKGRDRAGFMRDVRQAGYEPRPVKGLPRHFLLDGVAPDDLPESLRTHPAVEAIDDGEAKAHGADDHIQPITLDVQLADGSWAIARTIRRQAPWNVDHLRHPFATYFRSVRDGTGVDFYSLDTGIRTTHDEFGGRATNVYEAVSSGGEGDDHGHGTGTSSAACGVTVGIARGALLWSFKVLDSSNSGSLSNIVSGLGEALSHYTDRSGTNRPAVVNMSLGAEGTFSTLESAVADVIDAGMVLVAAAMNAMGDITSLSVVPATYDDVICAGGIGMADIPYYAGSAGTNYGNRVDVLAPSQSLRLAAVGGDSSISSGRLGTSFGCAYTSGVVACMLQGHDRLANRTEVQAVKAQLIANATTGRFRDAFGLEPLPDRILYLDPDQTAPGPISGL